MDRSDDVPFVADTTIHVSDELEDRKAPDESYEDVIRRLIERSEDDYGQVPSREGEPDPPDGSDSYRVDASPIRIPVGCRDAISPSAIADRGVIGVPPRGASHRRGRPYKRRRPP